MSDYEKKDFPLQSDVGRSVSIEIGEGSIVVTDLLEDHTLLEMSGSRIVHIDMPMSIQTLKELLTLIDQEIEKYDIEEYVWSRQSMIMDMHRQGLTPHEIALDVPFAVSAIVDVITRNGGTPNMWAGA